MPTGERIGRYLISDEIASGGMATVHLGRLVGDVGFSRTVAVKRLHPNFAKDPDFVAMFLDEARLAARVSHPNVVQTLDVVAQDDVLVLVMEYVRGESLAGLLRTCKRTGDKPPPDIAVAIMCGALHGLHAAHEAKDNNGVPIGLVHRDVSPHNVLVGVDGVARMLDFGIAKAVNQLHTTREGQLKGKLPYMAPEQLEGSEATRASDVYAAAIVLWETFTAKRCFEGDTPAAIIGQIKKGVPKASSLVEGLPDGLDAIIAKGAAVDPKERYASAREMALELEKLAPAAASKVGAWVEAHASDSLATRAERVSMLEADEMTRRHGRPSRPSLSSVPPANDGPVTGSMDVAGQAAASGPQAEIPSIEPAPAKAKGKTAPPRPWMIGAAALVVLGTAGAAMAVKKAKVGEPSEVESESIDPASKGAWDGKSAAPVLSASASASGSAAARPAIKTATPPKKPSCDPPFTLGANGKRIPKPECF